jgi:hypothetical protein
MEEIKSEIKNLLLISSAYSQKMAFLKLSFWICITQVRPCEFSASDYMKVEMLYFLSAVFANICNNSVAALFNL